MAYLKYSFFVFCASLLKINLVVNPSLNIWILFFSQLLASMLRQSLTRT